MKRLRGILYLSLGFLGAWAVEVYAASFSVSFTAGQDTAIQTRIIPLVNTANCARYRLGPSCSSANLVTNGCVAVAFPAKNYNVCTIYTTNLAGETTFLQDEINQRLVDRFIGLTANTNATFISTCQGRTQVQQDALCTANGQSAPCDPCP